MRYISIYPQFPNLYLIIVIFLTHTQTPLKESHYLLINEDVAHGLSVVPLADASRDLFQEVLVVLQDLRDLVEHLIHQRGIYQGSTVRLLQGLHVPLEGGKEREKGREGSMCLNV